MKTTFGQEEAPVFDPVESDDVVDSLVEELNVRVPSPRHSVVDALEIDLTREDSDKPLGEMQNSPLGELARWIPEPPRGSRRLVLTSGGRSDVSQEAVFEHWFATSPIAQDDEVPFLILAQAMGSIMGASEASGEDEFRDEEDEPVMAERAHSGVAMRTGFLSLDGVNVEDLFERRACVMKSVPKLLRGACQTVLRIAFREALSVDATRRERGRKLLMLALRMLLFKPARGGLVSRETLTSRFNKFSRGEWLDLIEAGAKCAEEATTVSRQRRSREVDVEEKRAAKVLAFVQVGELSSARQALEGAEPAPGNDTTLRELRNPARRPNVAQEPTPEEIRTLVPPEFEPDENLFLRTLRSSKRGSAGGPSGMTNEHLRPLLDSTHDGHLLFLAGEQSRAHVPPSIITLIRQGRLTALQKEGGGVRSSPGT